MFSCYFFSVVGILGVRKGSRVCLLQSTRTWYSDSTPPWTDELQTVSADNSLWGGSSRRVQSGKEGSRSIESGGTTAGVTRSCSTTRSCTVLRCRLATGSVWYCWWTLASAVIDIRERRGAGRYIGCVSDHG